MHLTAGCAVEYVVDRDNHVYTAALLMEMSNPMIDEVVERFLKLAAQWNG
jgi:hypothetical protein